jgi:hypothetical protein
VEIKRRFEKLKRRFGKLKQHFGLMKRLSAVLFLNKDGIYLNV